MIYQFGVLLLIGTSLTLTSALPPCACTREKKQVCGSDGRTYSNECMLKCAQATDPSVTLVSTGRCKREAPSCFCTFENNPLCASDGNTYSNECEFQCQQAAVPGLRIRHKGDCRSKRQVDFASFPHCTCPRDLKRVCGSDGTTYGNACLLECASRALPELYLMHDGPCDNGVMVVEQADNLGSCTCTRNYRPVCASNGVTFNNECLMRCSGTHLFVERQGPC